jgi:hypothetical protein
MAARAGAKSVISVEQNNHMADVGEECLVSLQHTPAAFGFART